MKAVRRVDKQRGHSRRHAGFNDRWDAMEKSGQIANGANARNVWTIAPAPFSEAHFATFPPALAERCIKAGTRAGDTVLDPFGGAGTTGLVADRLQRAAILIELNPQYVSLARKRIAADRGPLSDLFDGVQQNDGQ
jgi:DNA modification methylase